MAVSPNPFTSVIALQDFASLSDAIMREACDTTHTCVRFDAFSMSRARSFAGLRAPAPSSALFGFEEKITLNVQ